jgi:predicted alpha/beta-fold hydrolase
MGAIGFSLGGNVLLKYLGEHASNTDHTLPDVAATVSVPFDLAAGADHIERGMSRLYLWFLLRKLKRKVREKRAILDGRLDIDRALRSRGFWGFDDACTAPLHGFRNADDYYARSSSHQFLSAITVPTLLLQACDDPFLPASAIPRNAIARNDRIEAHVVRRGGHVGFVTGKPWSPIFWAERTAAVFVADRLRRMQDTSMHDIAHVTWSVRRSAR